MCCTHIDGVYIRARAYTQTVHTDISLIRSRKQHYTLITISSLETKSVMREYLK